MDNEKYILELDRKEAIMLGKIILTNGLYKTAYEPLQTLCRKVDGICSEVYRKHHVKDN